jgi:metal-responsive CopG/Arc/MetJ family transcriptional regulator
LLVKRLSEEEYKITVTLSRKGLNTLDTLKETSGFGSRGRTIEEAILTVSEITEMTSQIISQYAIDMQTQGKISDTTQLSIVGWFTVIVAKLTRFMRPK